jgi:outer membrane immunogenic protein
MKRIVIGLAAIASLFATGAIAADLAPRPYTKAPVIVDPGYNWTGFYVGANLGWSFGRSTTDYTIAGLPFGSTSQRMDGILGGLQAGYNWQNGRGLLGLEADIQGTGQKGSSSLTDFIPGTPGTPGTPAIPCIFIDGPRTPCQPGTGIAAVPGIPGIPAITGLVAYQNKLPWFGTFRGRIGFTPAERWLVYATGGLAYGEVETVESLTVGGTSVALNTNAIRLGWTLGGGIETAIRDGWTAKLEYLYIDFGSVTDSLVGIAPITPIATRSHVTDNIVRVGVNYRWGGPVVAKY